MVKLHTRSDPAERPKPTDATTTPSETMLTGPGYLNCTYHSDIGS